jgi:hypothetical protein
MDVVYVDKNWFEIEEQKKFLYGIPVHTSPFRALVILIY